MVTIIRDYEFLCYQTANGSQVMAGVIPEDVVLHLQSGEETFPAGSYELIHSDGKVTFMGKEDFEDEFVSVETEQTLAKTEVNLQKEGGD